MLRTEPWAFCIQTGCLNCQANSLVDVFNYQSCSKDHMHIGPQVYTFHAVEPAYKDNLCIRTTFFLFVPRAVFIYKFHCIPYTLTCH